MKKQKEKENRLPNCVLEVVKKGRYEDLYLTLLDGTRFQVKLAFFNSKLLYKVAKVVGYANKQDNKE